MDDDLLRLLAERDGIIMINFGSSFLGSTYGEESQPIGEQMQAHITEQGWSDDDPEAAAYLHEMRRSHPFGTVEDVADHIDHAVNLVGVDYVGLGSDFDGVTFLPAGLQDVSEYPNLIAELLERGYAEEDIQKILGENALRVWSAVEDAAE